MTDITRQEFDELKDTVRRNEKILRGDNGKGLVTTVEVILNDVKWIRENIEENNKTHITWAWIVERLVSPLVVGVIVGVIMLLAT